MVEGDGSVAFIEELSKKTALTSFSLNGMTIRFSKWLLNYNVLMFTGTLLRSKELSEILFEKMENVTGLTELRLNSNNLC